MEDILAKLITTSTGLALLGASYLIWLLTGVANNLFNDKKWSWKRMFEDIAKTVLMCVAILAWVCLCEGINWFAAQSGCDITKLMDGASVAGVVGGLIGGTIWYTVKAYKNIINFINANHVEVSTGEINYKSISDAVINIFSGINVQQESTENAGVEVVPELGGSCYYKLDTQTPTVFYKEANGKGFNEGCGYQCVAGFKEFQFSLAGRIVAAGGAASGYANALIITKVEALGFTWHAGTDGMQDGDWAIWTTGTYGHAAMRYDGRFFGQNQGAKDGSVGNPFNLMWLSTDGIAGYYRPNIYQKSNVEPVSEPKVEPTPEPAKKDDPAPEPEPGFKVGDEVIPIKLVDYNGTKLRQYDDTYVITQLSDDRAVLSAIRGNESIVWAAMNTCNIKKV